MTDDNEPPFSPGDRVCCISTDRMYTHDGEFPGLTAGRFGTDLVCGQHYTVHKVGVKTNKHNGLCKYSIELVERPTPWNTNDHYWYYAHRFRKEPLAALPEPMWSLDDLELARMEIEEIGHD